VTLLAVGPVETCYYKGYYVCIWIVISRDLFTMLFHVFFTVTVSCTCAGEGLDSGLIMVPCAGSGVGSDSVSSTKIHSQAFPPVQFQVLALTQGWSQAQAWVSDSGTDEGKEPGFGAVSLF
jgi:hypothetical protein